MGLEKIAKHSTVKRTWVSVHRDVEGCQNTDSLASAGTIENSFQFIQKDVIDLVRYRYMQNKIFEKSNDYQS